VKKLLLALSLCMFFSSIHAVNRKRQRFASPETRANHHDESGSDASLHNSLSTLNNSSQPVALDEWNEKIILWEQFRDEDERALQDIFEKQQKQKMALKQLASKMPARSTPTASQYVSILCCCMPISFLAGYIAKTYSK